MVALVGPTASGKSDLAVELAERIGGEIVSVDSMQVYRGMDIGTAKPDAGMRRRVPHHLVDIAEPEDEVTVAEFRATGHHILDDLANRGVPAVVTGGSGLHFRALVDPLSMGPTDRELRRDLEARDGGELVERLLAADPDAGAVVDLANPRRVVRAVEVFELTGMTPTRRLESDEYRAVRDYVPERGFVGIGVDPGADLEARVAARLDGMFAAGLVDEVRRLAPRLGRTARHAVGYRQLLPVVAGDEDVESGWEATRRATLALAKRQRTFFRRDPRLHWISWGTAGDRQMGDIMQIVESGPPGSSGEATWTS